MPPARTSGSNRDLLTRVEEGRFRDDLLARINLRTFSLPALKNRREDIEPNLDYELDAFTRFAESSAALWRGNFRDLSASITRLATLSPTGRITEEAVTAEIARLSHAWRPASTPQADLCVEVLGSSKAAELDRFDRVQLADVLTVCRASKTLSEAGRTLFAASRVKKISVNDADRLRKFLARFGLTWIDVSARS